MPENQPNDNQRRVAIDAALRAYYNANRDHWHDDDREQMRKAIAAYLEHIRMPDAR